MSDETLNRKKKRWVVIIKFLLETLGVSNTLIFSPSHVMNTPRISLIDTESDSLTSEVMQAHTNRQANHVHQSSRWELSESFYLKSMLERIPSRESRLTEGRVAEAPDLVCPRFFNSSFIVLPVLDSDISIFR